MSRSELYLQHVLDAIGKVERYAAVGHDTFMAESHWEVTQTHIPQLRKAVEELLST